MARIKKILADSFFKKNIRENSPYLLYPCSIRLDSPKTSPFPYTTPCDNTWIIAYSEFQSRAYFPVLLLFVPSSPQIV